MKDLNFLTQSSLDLMLVFSILAPTACGFFALACGNASKARNIGIGILSVLHLINIINIKFFYDSHGTFSYQFIKISSAINISFATESYGVIFAIMVSILWVVTNLYSIGYIAAEQSSTVNKDTHSIKFSFFVSLAIAATMGVAFSANLLTLYICYELLTFVTYPLVNISGSEHSIKAGRKYLVMLVLTSLFFFLPAILYLYSLVGGLDFTSGGILHDKITAPQILILLIMFVLGTAKTAIFPVHSWLPSAMVAPVPVSALLHAVAVVKTGIFAMIKIIVYIFGIDFIHQMASEHQYIRQWLVLLCCFTIIFASIRAIQQEKIKQMLAYSTISQLGYSLLAIAMFTPKAIFAGFIYMIAHALSKIVLFFAAGAIYTSTGITDIKDIRGVAHLMPGIFTCFILCSLSLIGIPPMAGFFGKYLIIEASWNDPMYLVILSTIIIGTILAVGYFLEFIYIGMMPPLDKDENIMPVPKLMKIATITVTIFVVLFVIIANYLYRYFNIYS